MPPETARQFGAVDHELDFTILHKDRPCTIWCKIGEASITYHVPTRRDGWNIAALLARELSEKPELIYGW